MLHRTDETSFKICIKEYYSTMKKAVQKHSVLAKHIYLNNHRIYWFNVKFWVRKTNTFRNA